MKRILRYLRARHFDRELNAETQSHLDEAIEELIASGLSPEEALLQARRTFGNRTRLEEKSREKWAYRWVDEFGQDLRYALRVLRKSPVFTVVAVLSLGLGIGANTVIFSAVENVLLQSLPYPQADRLYDVWARPARRGSELMHISAGDFYDFESETKSFTALAGYTSWPVNLTNVDEPRRLETLLTSTGLFSALGVNAALGRTFAAGEDSEKSPFVVVISHHLWRLLGEPSDIPGHRLTLNGAQANVIGVMPASFAFPSKATDAWIPLSLDAANRGNREGRWLTVIARLRPNVLKRDASAEMDVLAARLAAAYPTTDKGWGVTLVPLHEDVIGKARPILLTLQAGALVLLLIACANLANMLLAKDAARTREIGLRVALGAGRGRIFRQLTVESALIAFLGGSLGMVLASQGILIVRAFGDGLIPRADEIHLSLPVALFAFAATAITAFIFGLAPALHASRADLRTHIGSGGRGTDRKVERKRGLLITSEIALASVLLVGAGLLSESLVHLLSTAPGFQTNHVLTMRLTLSRPKYPTNAAQYTFLEDIVDRVRKMPGVQAAAEISDTPLLGNNPTFEWVIEGLVRGPSDSPVQAGYRAISTGYLQAAGIPLFKGRDFAATDRAGTPPVVMVNEAMARRYWPGSNPVGRALRLKEEQRWMTVAGVVPDIKHLGLKADEGPVVYIPYAQKTQDWLAWTTLVVRTARDPTASARDVRNLIHAVDKNQPVAEISTFDEILFRSTAMPRFTTLVIAAVSIFALSIAAVGVYGLLAYTVAQRMPEFGIRLALGASPVQVSWMLLRQAMRRVLVGVGAGLLCSWWLARWIESLLFGVRPDDPGTFAGVAGLLIIVSLVAVLCPAVRAMRINPATALRSD